MSISPVFDIEVRAFDRAGGTRLNFNPKLVERVTWSYVERGGAEMATVIIKVPFEEIPVNNGDFLEIWALNTGEAVPRWRGIVNVPERCLSTNEKHTITAYGRMEDMSHVVLDKIMVNPATLDSSGSLVGGADLSQYAGQILTDYQSRLSQASTSYQPWLNFSGAPSTIGVNLVQLDATLTTARAAMDALADQAGNNAVWGWDIDPVTGVDRFYFRPRGTSIGSQFYIGVGVQEITAPSEFQAITNAAWIKGGPALYPNKAYNPSFEVPNIPDGASGSLLVDGGFEDLIGPTWNFGTNTGRGSYNPPTSFWTPHSGTWFGQITARGAELNQEVSIPSSSITNAQPYVCALFARQANNIDLASAEVIVEGRDSSDALTETWAQTIQITPTNVPSTVWIGGQPGTTIGATSLSISGVFKNSSTVKAKIRIIGGSTFPTASAIIVDDVTFNVLDAIGQSGWGNYTQDGNASLDSFNSVDWGCTDNAADGYYCIRCDVAQSSSTHRTAIETAPGTLNGATGYRFATEGGESLFCACMVRMKPELQPSGVTSGVVNMDLQGLGSGEVIEQTTDSSAWTIPADGKWYLIILNSSTGNNIFIDGPTTLGLILVAFQSPGVYDIDAFTVRDPAGMPLTLAAITTAGSVTWPTSATAYGPLYGTYASSAVVNTYLAEYLRGTDFEAYLDVTNLSVAASGLTTGPNGAASSISNYGRREQVLSNKQIIALVPDTYTWIAAWFNQFAVPISRTRVKLDDEQVQMPDPGSPDASGNAQLVRVSGTSNDIPDQYSTKTTYTWGPSAKLGIDIELTTQRPTLAKLLLSAAQASGGSGAASTTGAIAAAQSSSQGGGSGAGNQSTPSTNFGTSASPNVTGSVNGTNTSFVLTQTPVIGFEVIADGVRLLDGTDYAYTASTLTVVTTIAPQHWIVANIC